MPFALKTFLFGDYRIAKATSGPSPFGHTFGGPHDRKGTAREDCKGILIHLLHRLDLSDPEIPIEIPGVRWLPFYYCFDFRANDLGYRLTSDDALIAYFPDDDRNVTDHEEWPDKNYPPEFPRSEIKIERHQFDPTNLEDACTWSGVFGIGKLSKNDRAIAKKRVAEDMAMCGAGAPETEQDYQDNLSSPFAQGKPKARCLNPGCPNHKIKGGLSTIALMPAEPVSGVHTFGRWGAGVQLIIQICPKCYAIRVTNQCT